MILNILATVAVLAAIVVMLSALVFAESVLVYIALGLGATSVLLMIGAFAQQRSGTAGPERELSGTDGLGKSSVPVAQAGALATGATAIGSISDTDAPEDSRRGPASASEPVRDTSVPGTDTVEEGIDHGKPGDGVPHWQTSTPDDRPDPGTSHVPAPDGSSDEETTPALAPPAGISAFDDEEVPFSSSVRAAEAEHEDSTHLTWSFGPGETTDTGSEPGQDQTSAPEQVEPEEAPATARTPDTDDGEPAYEDGEDGEDGAGESDARTLESAEAEVSESAADLAEEDCEGAAEPAPVEDEEPEEEPVAELSETGGDAEPELPSDRVEETPADQTVSTEDEGPAESVSPSAGDRDPETESEAGTETPEVEEGEAGDPVEGPAKGSVPADEPDNVNTAEEADSDLEPQDVEDLSQDVIVSADGDEDSFEQGSAQDSELAPGADADGSDVGDPDADQDESPGQDTEDEPSADDTGEEQGSDDKDDQPRADNAGEHAVAYAVIVDSEHDSTDREADTVGAEDPGAAR